MENFRKWETLVFPILSSLEVTICELQLLDYSSESSKFTNGKHNFVKILLMKKKLFTILIVFISLLINGLQAQSPESKSQIEQEDSLVGFTVDTDGSLQDIHVVHLSKTTSYNIKEAFFDDLKEESIRVARLMPRWIPATEQGKPRRAAFTLVIPFWVE